VSVLRTAYTLRLPHPNVSQILSKPSQFWFFKEIANHWHTPLHTALRTGAGHRLRQEQIHMQKLAAITKEPRNADWRSGTLSMYHKDLTTRLQNISDGPTNPGGIWYRDVIDFIFFSELTHYRTALRDRWGGGRRRLKSCRRVFLHILYIGTYHSTIIVISALWFRIFFT